MNDSGQAVRAAADFYKLGPEDVVVFYDELDLAPGKLRVKTGGGAAGHNGIRSIDAHLGNAFRRVRIGIGHPGNKSQVTTHVLGNFSKSDEQWLSPLLSAISQAAPFLTSDDQRFASDVAQRIAPARGEGKKGAPTPKQATHKKPTGTPISSEDKTPSGESVAPENQEPDNPFASALRNLLGNKKQDT